MAEAPSESTESTDSTSDAPEASVAAEPEGGLDVEAEQRKLDDVEKQIADGRRALADREQEIEPEPDGPPVAQGEGAANAPPG
ncbi:MAG: hypothetical protein AVDCRST_MAG76-437 [uncultured Acidimicrobiales bacterium]|uniref:Uncharacterized protein n=1 Tax=uncultured Acidimicrobiales bacterium TaxID=310071 RepID=A0A6J4H820_9ACTN|nr:MAG: hypothetical protein AVDCRST_MAG76-437 [uncultured Acidimicrobiales bacterium]